MKTRDSAENTSDKSTIRHSKISGSSMIQSKMELRVSQSQNHSFEPIQLEWDQNKIQGIINRLPEIEDGLELAFEYPCEGHQEQTGALINKITALSKCCYQTNEISANFDFGYSKESTSMYLNKSDLQEKQQLLLPSNPRHLSQQIKTSNLVLKTQYFNSIQYINFEKCSLGKKAVEVVVCAYSLKNLEYLNLSENSIGNEGIKLLTDTSNWAKLKNLTLRRVQIDHQGAKWLSMNESWVNLKELDLSENPLVGDLGALSIGLNRSWTQIHKLSLWNVT